MKKIILSLFIIFMSFNINITNSYSSISATKTEIDNIKCDLNYTGELRQGFSYEFSDYFSNSENSDMKIEEVKVHTYEQSDYNNSTDLLQFDYTDWMKSKNNILLKSDSGKVIESTNKYKIVKINTIQDKENFKITYTAKYFIKDNNGNFTKGPFYHTECKDYKVSGCGDGILDTNYGEECDFNDPDKKNWGTDGCSNTCQPKEKTETINSNKTINTSYKNKINNKEKPEVTKEVIITPEIEDLSEYEKYIKQEIFKYKANKIKFNKILKEENERGIGLIKLPKILPKTGTPILNRVKKLQNSKLNLDLIDSRFRLAGNNNSDLNFWKQVLPNEDKNAKKYIVIPSNGLVIPVNEVPSNVTDYNSLLSGREIKVNKYLKTGAMEYAGTSINGYGKVGNKVIFAHSSYFKSDNGRYKTDFQKIIELNKGEEIWIYVKENGKYKRYKYKTVETYNTKPTNVDVLKPGIGKNLTLFTCTPIGGISGRWIVEAKYIDDNKTDLENKLKFNNINSKLKSKIDVLVYKISKLEEKKKKEKILKIFKILVKKENSITNPQTINILNYLKYKLALEYYK